MKERAEMTREAARVTWSFLAGVGSSSKRKLRSLVDAYKPDIQRVEVEDDRVVKIEVRIIPYNELAEYRTCTVQNCSI